MTRNILFREELGRGWKLYAKTGCGRLRDKGGVPHKDQQIGWFVEWIQKGPRTIIFAQLIQDKDQEKLSVWLQE